MFINFHSPLKQLNIKQTNKKSTKVVDWKVFKTQLRNKLMWKLKVNQN